MQPIGIYIHVPFCESKCPYCDFYSLPFSDEQADAYTKAVCRALANSPAQGQKADTLYFGGGTPFLLGADRLIQILEAARSVFGLAHAEITLEANPGSLKKEALQRLVAAGFGRISLGVQSLIEPELLALGRRHTAEEALAGIEMALDAGFEQVSADLMLGIPHQTPESLAASLAGLVSSGICHLSAYILKVEPDTPFARHNLAERCADEDQVADLYLQTVGILEEYGFSQYEISNFCHGDRISRHNYKYWDSTPYLGIGPAAHSFFDGKRFAFDRDLAAFIEAEDPWQNVVFHGEGGDWEEYAMLRLRLSEGLNPFELEHRFGMHTEEMLSRAAFLEKQGLVSMRGSNIALTPRGFLLSNAVTVKLLYG